MISDPWTDDEPDAGDFDADLVALDPRYVELSDGDAEAKLLVLVGVEGDDVARLERVSAARGKTPASAVAELLREADRAGSS